MRKQTVNNIFDSHTHYDDKQFGVDRDALLASMPQKGVRCIVNIASDLRSAEAGIALARRYRYIYCTVGVHPHEAKDAPEDLERRLESLVAAEPKVRAVGEIGLDYHYDFSPREKQREIFERQLAVALKLDLPVVVHDREAHGETLELLRKYKPRGIVHCYSGSAEMVGELIRLGLYIGFTGVVTFKNAKKPLEAVKAVPLERLLIETDCPYMAPEPYRGKRCDSSMLPQTILAIAAAKGVEPQELCDITCRNACAVYGIAEGGADS